MNPLVRLGNVEKYFEHGVSRTYVLRQVNLEIGPGDFLSIMGPSGAGKSTLLHILGMHDMAWHGEYWLGDQPIHKLGKKERMEHYKSQFGFVFQSYHLLTAAGPQRVDAGGQRWAEDRHQHCKRPDSDPLNGKGASVNEVRRPSAAPRRTSRCRSAR